MFEFAGQSASLTVANAVPNRAHGRSMTLFATSFRSPVALAGDFTLYTLPPRPVIVERWELAKNPHVKQYF